MLISLIAAMAEDRVIGVEDKLLPWHLPSDLKRFFAITRGHAVIMGRKTWVKFPKALPHRLNIVVSRSLEVAPPVVVARSIEDALRQVPSSETEAFIIGGAEIFNATLAMADKLYLTEIHAAFQGDTFFPALPAGDFEVVSREPHEENGIAFEYVDYVRVSGGRSRAGR